MSSFRTHIKHRFNEFASLELEEHSGAFFVTYYTKELNTLYDDPDFAGEPEFAYYANNADKYLDYNDALRGFNQRRMSENPFLSLYQYGG